MDPLSATTKLLAAASENNLAAAHDAINDGADITNNGGVALRIAVLYGYEEIVDLLLSQGAPIGDSSALTIASRRPNSAGIIESLLQFGADVHAFNDIAIVHAASIPNNVETVQLLITNDINVKTQQNQAIINASDIPNNADVVTLLLQRGAAPVSLNVALEHAEQNLDVIEVLLRAGAEVLPRHLIRCQQLGYDDAFALLSQYVSDSRSFRDRDGTTFMMNDVYHGFFDTFCSEASVDKDVTPLRNMLLTAAHELKLTSDDIYVVSRADAPILCQWMRERQQERCRICSNETDPITWNNVSDIPLMFLYFVNENDKTFCYDVITLSIAVMRTPVNPLTNVPLPTAVIEDISRRFTKIASMMATLVNLYRVRSD